MANIPTTDGPRVVSRPEEPQYTHTNYDTGGAEVANALNNFGAGVAHAGGVISEVAAKARAEANGIAANDAITAYQDANISIMDGDAKAGTPGFLSTKGQQAAEAYDGTVERLAKTRQAISTGLTNDEQRKLFHQHSASIYEGSRARVESHTSQQREVAKEMSLTGRMATELNFIANNYADDAQVADRADAVAKTLHAFALSPEDGAAKVQAWQEKVAEVRLTKYLGDKDWKGAENLYAQTKDVLGARGTQIQKSIEVLKTDLQGEEAAGRLIASARSEENGRVDSAKALASLDSIPAGPMRDEVRGRLANKVAAEEHAWNTKVNGVADSVLTEYLRDGNSLDHVTSSAKSWLIENAPEQWRKLQQMEHSDQEQKARGGPQTPEQTTAMTRFLVDAADHPEKYAVMPAAQFNASVIPLLAKNDRERAGSVLANLHAQVSKPEKLSPIEDRMLLQQGREAGVFPPKENDVSKWGDDAQAQNYYLAQQKLTAQAAEYHRAHGKPPPPEEVKKWVGEILLAGKDPTTGIAGYFQTSTTPLQAEVAGTKFEPTWTSKDKDAARAALTAAGHPGVTDAIVETYLRRKHGMSAAGTQAAPKPKPYVPPPEAPSNTTDSRGLPGAPRFGESKL